jgi:dipeptidyl aminopeptidase/acylaminoacyl peptidase
MRNSLLLLLTSILVFVPCALRADADEQPAETKAEAEKQDEAKAKKPRRLTTAEYGQWERLGQWELSPDGAWLAWQVRRVDGENKLHLRSVKGETKKDWKYATGQTFSDDNRWLAFRIGVSPKAAEAMAKARKPVRTKLGLHDLKTGKTEEIDDIASFRFSDGGQYLLMRGFKPDGQKHAGVTTLVRDLATGRDTPFGNVASASWMDDAPLLAMVLDTDGQAGNGVLVYNPKTSHLRTLDAAKRAYSSMTWRKDAADLAILREREHAKDEDASFEVLTWRGLDQAEPTAALYDHLADEEFPKEKRIVSQGRLRWADHGETVFFGVMDWENKPKPKKGKGDGKDKDTSKDKPAADAKAPTKQKAGDEAKEAKKPDAEEPPAKTPDATDGEPKDDDDAGDPKKEPEPGKEPPTEPGKPEEQAPGDKSKAATKSAKPKKPAPKTLRETIKEPAGVDIWHSRDIDIQPRQKKQLQVRKNENHLWALWIAEGRAVMLGDEEVEKTQLGDAFTRAFGRDLTPYEEEQRFGPELADVYTIDIGTGARKRVLERNKYLLGSGPKDRFLLYVKDDHIWTYDCKDDEHRNLTAQVKADFINREGDTLTDEKPPYGVAGWSEDGAYVFLYDQFDIWQFAAAGDKRRRLTAGAEKQVRRRRIILDREDDEFIRPDRPMYVSTYGEWTKQTGVGRLEVLQGGAPAHESLITRDLGLSRLVKAKDADVFAYVQESFTDSPDIFVGGPALADAKQMTETNPFQKDYVWSERVALVDYENAQGKRLQGALRYPAGYEQGKQYPMIVNIYERMSQTLHRYSAPMEIHPYNASVFTTEGYFFFTPDIAYRPQNPGLSALECVVPAVKAVLARGDVDPKRIGLMGHSWGAYQTTFIVTQTKLFAAGVAGAPLTNMLSMSMNIYWNSGQTNARIFHESQGRMDRPFWEDTETYIKNSPIFSIEKLDTPLLIAFGDQDGAVDWHQGIEMYNAARLAQKPLVMLVYAGENHGLRKKPNQVDYHHRVREWFDHHLRGAEAKTWITEGKSAYERMKEIEAKQKDAKKGPPRPGRPTK